MTMDTSVPAGSSAASPVNRYHPVQVILHWLIAALIIITALLASGAEGEGRRAAGSTSTLAIHMILGITVLVLLVVRLVVRLSREETIGEHDIVYLNRLSDLLFVVARWINALGNTPETTWQPR